MINLENLYTVINKIAPLLVIGLKSTSPVSAMILNLIADAFGAKIDDNLATTIANDPDASVKLKQIEMDHQNVLIQSQVQDRMSAREREEKIVELTHKRDWVIDAIAITVILGFFSLCLVNYFVSPSDDHIISMLIGQVSGAFVMVLSYYFGSSKD
jgi:hypothetical protein